MTEMPKPGRRSGRRLKVAIACQGGGSHAAYGAGVLARFLADPWFCTEVEVVGISGTSGGAINAALFWPGPGAAHRAKARLEGFWNDLSNPYGLDQWVNQWALWFQRVGRLALPGAFSVERVNPFVSAWCELSMRRLLDRHLDMNMTGSGPALFIGATDLDEGRRTVFQHLPDRPITADHIIASAAVPPLYMAKAIDGKSYWDGLFTSNPPVRELANVCKPDQIWVIRINPQKRSLCELWPDDVLDRRNELAGNTALDREIEGIEAVNEALRSAQVHTLAREAGEAPFKRMAVLSVPPPDTPLDLLSKFDISARLVARLQAAGAAAAKAFLDARRSEMATATS